MHRRATNSGVLWRETSVAGRIAGFDVARALAIFGMVFVNFKIVMGADKNGPHWLLTFVSQFEGRAAALFVVLAGVGMSLVARDAVTHGDAGVLRRIRVDFFKRAMILFMLGLAYTPIWPADILHFYGLYIAIGALCLTFSNRMLASVAAFLTVFFVSLLVALDYEAGWNWDTLSYLDFWTPGGFLRHLFFNGFHPVIPWLAFLLFGMILGRLDLTKPTVGIRLLTLGLLAVIVAEFVSFILLTVVTPETSGMNRTDIEALFGTGPMPPMPLYVLAGAGTASVVIAACVFLAERHGDSRWLKPLILTGQLALTLYVAHVVIGMGLLEAFDRLENQTPRFTVAAATVFCVAGVVFASFWRRRFARGPLEWLLRSVTTTKN